MSINKDPLGMNARNFLYIARFNNGASKRRADDKLETKQALLSENIPTAKILHIFRTRQNIKKYLWDLPTTGFVIKPSRGFGGEGILVFDKWGGNIATSVSGKTYTLKQIKSHILDIFDGIYSLQSLPDIAYIEERIKPNNFFKKLAPIGLPDIRVIVFNKIPIMAMVRLPTERSNGKANLHQGAVGIGIEMRTGITNYAFSAGKMVKRIPDTKVKAAGIKIPEWDNILLLASKTQTAVGLGYAGVDIVLDRNKGPVVIEVNARPGLSIQNVNQASLRARLETVENLKVPSDARGVEIAKSIFAEEFSEKVSTETKVLSIIEPIIITHNRYSKQFNAKIDTGAYRTSLDFSVVSEMGIPLLKERFRAVSATGRDERNGVKITFTLGGKKITTVATVTNRAHLRFPIIIGRRDLKGFHVDPSLNLTGEEEIEEDKISEEIVN